MIRSRPVPRIARRISRGAEELLRAREHVREIEDGGPQRRIALEEGRGQAAGSAAHVDQMAVGRQVGGGQRGRVHLAPDAAHRGVELRRRLGVPPQVDPPVGAEPLVERGPVCANRVHQTAERVVVLLVPHHGHRVQGAGHVTAQRLARGRELPASRAGLAE